MLGKGRYVVRPNSYIECFLCLFWCGGMEWLHNMDWVGHFESPGLANTSSTEAFYSPRHRLMAGNRWYGPSDSRVFNRVDLHFWVHTQLSGQIIAKCSKRHVPSSGLLYLDLFGTVHSGKHSSPSILLLLYPWPLICYSFMFACHRHGHYRCLRVVVCACDSWAGMRKEQAVSMLVMDSIWSSSRCCLCSSHMFFSIPVPYIFFQDVSLHGLFHRPVNKTVLQNAILKIQ